MKDSDKLPGPVQKRIDEVWRTEVLRSRVKFAREAVDKALEQDVFDTDPVRQRKAVANAIRALAAQVESGMLGDYFSITWNGGHKIDVEILLPPQL